MSAGLAKKAFNYALAIMKHAADGFQKTTWETYHERVLACLSCPHVKATSEEFECGLCGCPIAKKALWRSEDCPHPSGSRWLKAGEPLPPFYNKDGNGSGGCGCNKK